MKKNLLHSKKEWSNQKEPFLPYQNKVKIAYFSYSGLFWFLGLLVYVFSFFIIINLAKNDKFHITSNINDINFSLTPIFNIILVTLSWILLILAPKKAYKSPRHSSIMFYFSFWFLIISVILNSQMQWLYMDIYGDASFYNWLNFTFAIIVIVLTVFALFVIQVFFWIMRRKFAFMPTDYEIYTQISIDRKARKQAKIERKSAKLLKKQNAKLANKKQ